MALYHWERTVSLNVLPVIFTCGAKLLRLWVRKLQGAGLFLLLLSISSLSLPTYLDLWSVLNQVPQKEVHL